MRITRIPALITAVAFVGLASCSDSTLSVPSMLSDSTVTTDVAINAGDAVATALEGMVANETAGALSAVSSNLSNPAISTLSYNRTRTCYDGAGTVVSNCTPIASVRKIVTRVTVDGIRSGSSSAAGGTIRTWSGVVHRVSNDTITRTFNTSQPPVETSRTHSDLTVGHDTTTFTEGDVTRAVAEATTDSIKAVTWNLPRSSNPFPVSGSIVRVVSLHVALTRGTRLETHDLTRKVQVDFPPDAQGNVVLKINDKTCTLNLVTHAVTNCK